MIRGDMAYGMANRVLKNLPPRAFAELSVVRLVRAVPVEDGKMPAGSAGTIIYAYNDGVGYEVEFERPFHAVVTLEGSDLAA